MSRVLPIVLVLLACVSAPPKPVVKPAPVMAAAPEPALDAEEVEELEEEAIRPPPPRRKREYLLTEKDYLGLMRAHPRGFQADTCMQLCKESIATTVSDDGRWQWTLRCSLKRNIREEPVVTCREDAVDLRPKKRPAGPSTYVIADD